MISLEIISSEEAGQGNVQGLVAKRWQEILKGTDLVPINVHTPMPYIIELDFEGDKLVGKHEHCYVEKEFKGNQRADKK